MNAIREQITDAITQARKLGCGHYIPVLEPVRDGRIALTVAVKRDAPVSMNKLRSATKPALVIISDDDYASTGPDGWTSAKNLMRWAAGVMVHAAGAKAEHYAAAVDSAVTLGRFVLVETSSAFAAEWILAAGGKPVLAIVPNDGPHPIMPNREAFN